MFKCILNQKFYFIAFNNENNEFNIIFQFQIEINRETDNFFSDYHLNSYIIQDKFLLVGTKIKKEKNRKIFNNNTIIEDKTIKKSGIYIINLDNKTTQMVYINNSLMINYIIPFKNNMFICNFESLCSKGQNFYCLSTFTLEEKKEKIILSKNYYINGRYKYINSNMIMRDFILCSSIKNNYLIRIYKDGMICNYFKNIFNNINVLY